MREGITQADIDAILTEGATRRLRTFAWRPGDAGWTNLSATLGGDWVTKIAVEAESPDQPAGRFTVTFLHTAGGESLAPGIENSAFNRDATLAYSPLLEPGASVRVEVQVSGGAWRPWLAGQIETTDWPGDEVVADCLTLDGVLLQTQIEAEEERNVPTDPDDPEADATPVALEIQWLLNRWGGGETLRVIGTPGWSVGHYVPEGSLGEQIRTLAQGNGWDVRYRWSEAAQDFVLTLFEPPRDKTAPDLQIAAHEVYEVPGLSKSRRWVRNAIVTRYRNSATSEIEQRTAVDAASIARYGRIAMILTEGDDSPIDGPDRADALNQLALSDLAYPLAEGRYRIPFLPWLQLGDIVAVQGDGIHFDHDTAWAITGVQHEVSGDGGAHTIIEGRGGKPVGMFLEWHRRARALPGDDTPSFAIQYAEDEAGTGASSTFDPSRHLYARTSEDGGATWSDWRPIRNVPEFGLVGFREVPPSQPGFRRWQWDRRGLAVAEVWWAYRLYPLPWLDDYEADIAQRVVPLPDDQDWVEVPAAVPADQNGLLWVEPRLADLSVFDDHVIEQRRLYPVEPKVAPWISAECESGVVNVYAGANPNESALPVAYEIREGADAETLLRSGVWVTASAAEAGASVLNQNPPESGKRTYWLRTVDVSGNVQWTAAGLENPRREVGDGAVDRIAAFAASFAPTVRVSSLPAEGDRVGERVLLWDTNSPQHKTVYQWSGSEWQVLTEAEYSVIYPGVVVANSISAVEISTVDLAVEQYIGSHNYVPGEEGWIIRGDGSGEFGDLWIRGDSIFEGLVALVRGQANNRISFQSSPGEEFADVSARTYQPPFGDPVSSVQFRVNEIERLSINAGPSLTPQILLSGTSRVAGTLTVEQDLTTFGPARFGVTDGASQLEVSDEPIPAEQGYTNVYLRAYWNGQVRRFHMRLDADRRAELVEVAA